jgi:hypothetical protein
MNWIRFIISQTVIHHDHHPHKGLMALNFEFQINFREGTQLTQRTAALLSGE